METTIRKKTSWKKVVLRTVFLLLLVFIGTLTWLINDTQFSKRLIEKQLTNLTHRTFEIKGDFDFTLGRDLKVTADGIKWANASWAKSPTMLEIDKAVVVVDFWSLFNPPVVLRDVSVESATLEFSWDEEKQSNWYLGDRSKPHDPNKKPLESLPLLLDNADIKNLDLQFRHPELTDDLMLKVVHAQHKANSDDDLVVDFEADIKGKPVSLVGSIGPFPKLIVAGALSFDLTAKTDNSNLSIKGDTPRLSKMDFTQFQAKFKSKETEKMIAALNLPLITHGPSELDINYQTSNGAANGKVLGNVGEFDVDVVMHVANLENWQGVVLNAKSEGPSALAAGKLLGVTMLPAEPYQLDFEIHDSGKGLLIDAANFTTSGVVVKASGRVKGFPKLTGIQVDFDASAKSIKPFTASLADHNFPDLPLQVKGRIDSKGTTGSDQLDLTIDLGEISASLNGELSEKEGFSGSVFQYTLSIPDSLVLNELIGGPIRSSVSIAFAGGIKIGGAGPVLTGTSGNVGENKLSLGSDIPLRVMKDEFSTTGDLSGPNAAAAIGIFSEIEGFPTSAFHISGNLVVSGKKVTFSPLQGNLGDDNFSIDGLLDLGQDRPVSNIKFNVNGPDLNGLISEFGLKRVPAKQYSATGVFELTEQTIEVSDLVFHIGKDQIKGAVSSGWPDQPENISFDVVASGDNLQQFLPALPNYAPEEVAFDLEVKGMADQKTITIETAKARIGGARFNLEGQVGMKPQWSANQVRLTGSGDHLDDLGVLYGWQFADLAFSISATMSGKENWLSIDDLLLQVGDNNLHGKLHADMQDIPEFDVDISSTYFDLEAVLTRIHDQLESSGVTVDGEAAVGSGEAIKRLIPAFDIPFDKLNLLNGTLDISIDKLITGRLDLKDYRLQASLKNGLLNVPEFSGQSAIATGGNGLGSIRGKLKVQAHPENSQVEVWINADNLILIQEAEDVDVGTKNPGQDTDLHLSGRGNDLRSLAASLNGYIWFQGGERKINVKGLNVLYGDLLTEVFTTILPFSKSTEYQTLECDRVFFEAKNGVLETAPSILFRTDKADIESIGLINLSTEEIDFNIQSTPRKGLGVSTAGLVNSFFRFQGTMANPKLQFDPTGTLVEGSAAIATIGLSIVAKSLYKRWLKKARSCEEMTEEARKLRAKINPDEVPVD